MSALSAADSGTATIADVIYMLQETKDELKRMETDLGASLNSCHEKIEDNLTTIQAQSKKWRNT